jgi:hypothetical protein
MTDTPLSAGQPWRTDEIGGPGRPARHTIGESDLATLAGVAAVVFPLVYFASELVEVAQGSFTTARLALTYLGEAGIVFTVLGLYAVQRPRIGRLGLYGALAYAYSFAFFASTVIYALAAGSNTWAAVTGVFGGWLTLHGAVMIAGGLMFGLAVVKTAALPRWTAACLMAGVVLVAATAGMSTVVRAGAAALPQAAFIGMGVMVLRERWRVRKLRATRAISSAPDRDTNRTQQAADAVGDVSGLRTGIEVVEIASTAPTPRELAAEIGNVAHDLPAFLTAPLFRRRHLRWGATPAEVAQALPGDDLLPRAQFNATRAITIGAPPDAVWPWLVQVGCLRAGWYSNDLLDNLGRPSATTIVPGLQHLEVGQWVPMSPSRTPSERTALQVRSFQVNRWLLWTMPGTTWAWQLTPIPGNGTRLVIRVHALYDWRHPLTAVLGLLLLEFGDFAMMRRMLRGIKSRAEGLVRGADGPLPSPGGSGSGETQGLQHQLRRSGEPGKPGKINTTGLSPKMMPRGSQRPENSLTR